DHGLDVADASRFMAMTTVTAADGLIACFDAKYHYAFWAADHRDPGRRHRRQRRHRPRPELAAAAAGDTEPPGVSERSRLRDHGDRPGDREVPRHARHRLHRAQHHRARRSPFRPAE